MSADFVCVHSLFSPLGLLAISCCPEYNIFAYVIDWRVVQLERNFVQQKEALFILEWREGAMARYGTNRKKGRYSVNSSFLEV